MSSSSSSSSPFLDYLSQIQNPLNVVLLVVLSYLLYPYIPSFSSSKTRSTPTSHTESYSWLPASHPDSIVWKEYTPRTLRKYDGTNEGEDRILFAIKGKVYDVTSGRNFYGPDGPYGNFAGRDASRGLAKQSFDLDMLVPIDGPIDTLEDLTPMEVNALREWEMHFQAKYFQCGDFVENH